METSSPLTRKDIARAVGVSVNTVIRRETEWGLNECRSAASHKPALYFRERVNAALLPRRIIIKPI